MNKPCLTCGKMFNGSRKTIHCSEECKTGKKDIKKQDTPKKDFPDLPQKEDKELTISGQSKVPITKQMVAPPIGSNAWKIRNGFFF